MKTPMKAKSVILFTVIILAVPFYLSGCAKTGNEFVTSGIEEKITGKTALMQACDDSNLEQVQRILTSKISLDQQDQNGDTALHYLVKNIASSYEEDADGPNQESKMILDLLISRSADPTIRNKQGISVLAYAAQCKDSETLRLLLEHSPKVDLTPDKDGNTLLHMAAQSASAENVRLVLYKAQGGKAFIDKPNNAGETPLMIAADISLEGIGTIDEVGSTEPGLTSWRMLGGGNPAFRELIRAGADTNLTDKNGESVLSKTINHQAHSNMIQLLKKGVSPNKPDLDGTFPLQQAISRCDGVAAHILIQAGASTTAAGSLGIAAPKLAKIKAEVCNENAGKLLLMMIVSKHPHKL